MKTPKHLTASLGTIVLLALGSSTLRAAPVVIDEFNENLPVTTDNAFVDGSMLGGEADYEWGGSVPFSISEGALKLDASQDSLTIVYDGNDDEIQWALDLGNIDLTSGGTNNRIEIDVTSLTGGPVDVEVVIVTGETPAEASGSALDIKGVTGPGVLKFPFSDFGEIVEPPGLSLGNPSSVSLIWVEFDTGDSGAEVEIASIRAVGDPAPDTIRPRIKFLKKKKLGKPRRRHAIRGRARDNDEVARVQARVQGKKGWRKAKLRPSGRFKYRTPRLKKKRTRVKVRAWDASGNRSKVKRMKVRGPKPSAPILEIPGGSRGRG